MFEKAGNIHNVICHRYVQCLYRQKGGIEGEMESNMWGGGRGGGGGEHAIECPKPLEQGIFLVDWAIHSRHVTLNFFHYKTLLPSPLQRQIACTYFTQWNIAPPPKQSFSSQSCEFFFETVISLCSLCNRDSGFLLTKQTTFLGLTSSLWYVYVWNIHTSASILHCVPSLHYLMVLFFSWSIVSIIDLISGISKTKKKKINFPLSAYMGLWRWAQFYTKSMWWHMK